MIFNPLFKFSLNQIIGLINHQKTLIKVIILTISHIKTKKIFIKRKKAKKSSKKAVYPKVHPIMIRVTIKEILIREVRIKIMEAIFKKVGTKIKSMKRVNLTIHHNIIKKIRKQISKNNLKEIKTKITVKIIIKEVKVKREKAKFKRVIATILIILMQKQNREVTNIE